MIDFMTFFGFVCSGLISFGVFLWSIAMWKDVKSRDYYTGLRNRINDTKADIATMLDDKDMLTRDEVMQILKGLHDGYWPSIQRIACEAKGRRENDHQ